jgi:hypothetical protein
MKSKIEDGRARPVINAKLDALLNLRGWQDHYTSNYGMRELWDEEEEEDELRSIRTQLELCEIELPTSEDQLRWLVSPEGHDIVSQLYGRALDGEPNSDVSQVALTALVENGLAAVLQKATTIKATVRCANIMREMVKADRTRYAWTQVDWASELRMSKKTINNCEAWEEIMAWRELQKQELVSKETGKKK